MEEKEIYLEKFEKQINRMFHFGEINPAAFCDAQTFIKSCNEYIDADAINCYRKIRDAANDFIELCKSEIEIAMESGSDQTANAYKRLYTEAEIIKLTMLLKKETVLSEKMNLVQTTDMSDEDLKLFENIRNCPNCNSSNVAVVYSDKSKKYFVQCQNCRSRLQHFSADSISGAMSTWNLCCRMANEIRQKYDPDNDNFSRDLEFEIPFQA